MFSSRDHDRSLQAALSAVVAAASCLSLADKFEADQPESARRVGSFLTQQRRFQQLNEYCDQTVAEIRASLER
jgi:hypothetical protein